MMVFASRMCTLKELTVRWSLMAFSSLELLNGLMFNHDELSFPGAKHELAVLCFRNQLMGRDCHKVVTQIYF